MFHNFIMYFLTHVGQLNKRIKLWLQSIGTFLKASSPSLCWVTLQERTQAAAIHQPEMMRAHGVHAEGGRSGCAACRWLVPRPGTFDPQSSVGLTCCCDLNHAHFSEGEGPGNFSRFRLRNTGAVFRAQSQIGCNPGMWHQWLITKQKTVY